MDCNRRVAYAHNYRQILLARQNPWLILWSDEASFSVSGSVATNTFVRYSTDQQGRPQQFNFETLKDKSTCTGWFAMAEDGTKLDPVRINGTLTGDTYIRYILGFFWD